MDFSRWTAEIEVHAELVLHVLNNFQYRVFFCSVDTLDKIFGDHYKGLQEFSFVRS